MYNINFVINKYVFELIVMFYNYVLLFVIVVHD